MSKVYIFHGFREDEPYASSAIRVFAKEEDAIRCLNEAVEYNFGSPPNELDIRGFERAYIEEKLVMIKGYENGWIDFFVEEHEVEQ